MPLGRDCSISVGGVTLTTARRVSITRSATEIECPLYGDSQYAMVFAGPETTSIEVEVLGASDALSLASAMNSRAAVAVSSTNASGTYRVTGMQIDEPLDGPVSYVATLKRSVQE